MSRNRSSSDEATGATRSTAIPSASSRREHLGDDLAVHGRLGRERHADAAVVLALRGRRSGTAASRPAARTLGAASMSISRAWAATSSAIVPCAMTWPLVDDRGDVARLLDLVEQVRGEQHRAALGDQVADQVAELEDAGGIEAVDRLVEDQQLRVAQQAAGDAEPLAHAERVACRRVPSAAPAEADALERRVDAPVGVMAARGGVHMEVLAARQVRMEARLLDDRPDAGERSARSRGISLPRTRIVPLVGLREPEQQPDQRRLAGAVGPEEAEGASARHLEVDALERRTVPEALPEAGGVDGQMRSCSEPTAGSPAPTSAARLNRAACLIRSDETARRAAPRSARRRTPARAQPVRSTCSDSSTSTVELAAVELDGHGRVAAAQRRGRRPRRTRRCRTTASPPRRARRCGRGSWSAPSRSRTTCWCGSGTAARARSPGRSPSGRAARARRDPAMRIAHCGLPIETCWNACPRPRRVPSGGPPG